MNAKSFQLWGVYSIFGQHLDIIISLVVCILARCRMKFGLNVKWKEESYNEGRSSASETCTLHVYDNCKKNQLFVQRKNASSTSTNVGKAKAGM